MGKLIELTGRATGEPVLITPSRVVEVIPQSDGGTWVITSRNDCSPPGYKDRDSRPIVSESSEEIRDKIINGPFIETGD